MGSMISVVVTTWGKQPKACLQSVRAQNVVKEIIQIENGNGACAARNEGAAKATGEYIIFVDGDIMLMPGVLKKMADILEALPEIAFVYGDYRRTGAWKKIFTHQDFHSQAYDLFDLCKMNYIPTTALVRRELIPEWDENINRLNDWDFWLTIALAGGEGYYLSECIFTAHFSEGDISMGGQEEYAAAYKKVAKKHMDKIRNGE